MLITVLVGRPKPLLGSWLTINIDGLTVKLSANWPCIALKSLIMPCSLVGNQNFISGNANAISFIATNISKDCKSPLVNQRK